MANATIVYAPHGGGPMPLLDEALHANMNRFLRTVPTTIPRPDAIVVVSAHWEEPVISITAAQFPTLLFDYHGFPPEAYEFEYPAPGAPQLAERVHALLRADEIESKLDPQRDFDHGLFIPLMLMYPDADIPCIQISLSSSLDAGLHVRVGKALSSLKDENLLILGSGFSFHNMQAAAGRDRDRVDLKNREFETWLARTCTDSTISESRREALLIDWQEAPHARYCHPREEHLLPLQVCYGIAQGAAKITFQEPIYGFMTSAYQW